MATSWLWWSLAALALWAFWGVATKLVLEGLEWSQAIVFGAASSILIAILVAVLARPSFDVPPERFALAVAASLLGGIGTIALFLALRSGGQASVVIPLTAAYPVLTALLSILLLGERPEPTKLAAAALFVLATVLVAR